jgi:hypothetical protein
MRPWAVGALFFGFLSANQSLTQSGAVIPQGGVGHAVQASCVILKRMGPADQVTSHLYSFGIRGKQFQYVEGKLPEGFPFHGRLTDHDVRNLQGRGAEVIVLNPNFTAEDLKQARTDCREETGKTPNQPTPSQAAAGVSNPAAAQTTKTGVANDLEKTSTAASEFEGVTKTSAAKFSIASNPTSADVEVDGSFVGNTPSDIQVTEGEHTISVKKAGFKDWERKLRVSGGSSVHLNAELEKTPGQ